MATAAVLHRLSGHFGAETQAIAEFVELLKLEQAALVDGDIEQLPAIVQRKDARVAALLNLAQQRQAMLAALSPAPAAGTAPEFGQGAPAEAARAAWRKLNGVSAEAAEMNRLNGQLIGQHRRRCEQALTVLTASANRQTIYGPDGTHAQSGYSRSIGSA